MARFPGAHVSEAMRYERKHPEDRSGQITKKTLGGRIKKNPQKYTCKGCGKTFVMGSHRDQLHLARA